MPLQQLAVAVTQKAEEPGRAFDVGEAEGHRAGRQRAGGRRPHWSRPRRPPWTDEAVTRCLVLGTATGPVEVWLVEENVVFEAL